MGMELNKLRFLITNGSLARFAGSEVVTLELATFLANQGASVSVYTHYLHDPMKQCFVDRGIPVVDQPVNDLHLGDFDCVWVHHQTLPQNFFPELTETDPSHRPVFIFHHMSAFERLPLERPFLFDLEEKIASAILFVSPEARDAQAHLYADRTRFALFPNPCLPEFSQYGYQPASDLRSVLITSNHAPQEITQARVLLEDQGVHTVVLGEYGDEYKLVTPEFLANFDAVITIGKTVQYCLTMGVPVYVYDIHGGPGWLDDENFDRAATHNFSGRDTPEHKTPLDITAQLIEGFPHARTFQDNNRARFVDDYSMDRVLPCVLADLGPRSTKIDERYADCLLTTETLVQNLTFQIGFFEHMSYHGRAEIHQRDSTIVRLESELSQSRDESRHVTAALHGVLDSTIFKIVRAVTAPIRALKGIGRNPDN